MTAYVDDPQPKATSQIGPWGMVPAWVLNYLKGTDVAIYVSLRTFADQAGYGYPHTKTIAERAGVSVSATRKAIQKMRALGLVHTTERRRSDGSLAGLDYYLIDIDPQTPIHPGGVSQLGYKSPPAQKPHIPSSEQVTHTGHGGRTPGIPKNTPPNTPVLNTPENLLSPLRSNSSVDNEQGPDRGGEGQDSFETQAKNLLENLHAPFHLGTKSVNEFSPLVVAALTGTNGTPWTVEALTHELTRDPEGVRAGRGVIKYRLEDLPAEAPTPGQPTPSRPQWCGHCSETTRLLDTEESVTRCPSCHPLQAGSHA